MNTCRVCSPLKMLMGRLIPGIILIFSTHALHAQDPLYISSSGNVGLGTNDPRHRLQLNGNMHTNGGIIYLRQDPTDLVDYIRWNATSDKVDIAGWNGVTLGYTVGNSMYKVALAANYDKVEVFGDLKLNLGKKIWWDWENRSIDVVGYPNNSTVLRFKNSMNVSSGNPNGGFDFTDHSGTSVMRVIDYCVGVGTSTPSARLHVLGNVYTSIQPTHNSADVHNEIYRGNTRFGMLSGEFTGMELETKPYGCGNGGVVKFYTWGCNTAGSREVVRISEMGYIGVGTTSPSAPIDVRIAGTAYCPSIQDQYSLFGYRWNANRGNDVLYELSGHYQGANHGNISIYASGNVMANAYIAYSDSRIKTGASVSDARRDLELINRINITDYKYIDNVANDSRLKKGCIAQQVETVFPQAVSTKTGFIPDIFTMAHKVSVNNDVLTITMKEPHKLVNGDVIQIMPEDGTTKEVTATVIDEHTFTVAGWLVPVTRVFIYGKKVNDYRAVDYQQIFSMGISAIQQLTKEVEELKAENAELRKRERINTEALASIQNRLQAIENKMEAAVKTASK